MPQSSTLYVGLEVHKDSLAVASAATDPHAAVVSRGHSGTRQRDSAPLVRRLQAKSPQRVFVSEAGPWEAWLARSWAKKDHVSGMVAPSLRPKKTSARVPTNRRDAIQRPVFSRHAGGQFLELRVLSRALRQEVYALAKGYRAAHCSRP